MKAPHKIGPNRGKQPGRGPAPAPPKPPKPVHKKPPKPKPAPKPTKTKTHRKPRQWSPSSDVACCSSQALGTLLGWRWDDVLALYWRTASDPDSGASIAETLAAAGCPACVWPYGVTPGAGASLILGVTLPQPHAVAVTPDGRWWSWGDPFNPAAWPGLVIEEAWCLR